jgi:thiamine pyrophosphate-dependent acetolactate synthase large subunit-like protein
VARTPARRERPTGAARLVEALEALGVELVFGLPGVHNLAVWNVLATSGIRLVGVRHEQTAGYAADGYARAGGRLGVALVTTGPGAANTLAAIGEARASGSPVLVIATDIPAQLRREGVYRGVLHETRNQPAMFAPVVKHAHTVAAADDIATDVLEAGIRARTAPSGPVYVGIPADLLTHAPAAPARPRPAAAAHPPAPSDPPAPDADSDEAARLVRDARRPLIWAGGGALHAGAGPAVALLAERIAAPVICTYTARGLLASGHPCAVPGPVHLPEVGVLWDEADLVIAIGSDFDGMMTQNWAMPQPPRLLALNVDRADAAKAYHPDATLVGDARTLTEMLAERTPARDGLDLLAARLRDIARSVRSRLLADDADAVAFLDAMHLALPADAVVVADMCIPGYWLGGFLDVGAPRRLAYPVGWGTLGFGFPASLGAALAGGGRTVCVCGDGGFLYACGDLATAVQESIPLTVVLVDDGGYGMLRFDQRSRGEEPFGVDLHGPDFVSLARSFGVDAGLVDGFGPPFAQRLADCLRDEGPNMLVVRASLRPPMNTSPRWYRRAPPAATAAAAATAIDRQEDP